MPGQPGTKKLLQKYGDELVCVRYRYDLKSKKKVKTVELIVEESPWKQNHQRMHPNKIVGIRVDYDEIYFRKLAKAAGGKWNREKKLWELPYKSVVELGLEERLIDPQQKNG